MPVQIPGSPTASLAQYPRQIELQVEGPVNVPAKSCADAANGRPSFIFTVERLVGSPREIMEQQAAQVIPPRDQPAQQIGCVEFEVGDKAGIPGDFPLQKSADGCSSRNAELLTGYERMRAELCVDGNPDLPIGLGRAASKSLDSPLSAQGRFLLKAM